MLLTLFPKLIAETMQCHVYCIAIRATSTCYVQVDALRHKVTSLEDDLKSSTTANSQLQQQLSEVKNSLSSSTRQLTEERNSLQLQVRMVCAC